VFDFLEDNMKKKVHTNIFFKKSTIQQNKIGCLGQFYIKAAEPGFLTKNQIEASRKILARTLKKVNGRS
jgi:ribosomal protein L16/L10AE